MHDIGTMYKCLRKIKNFKKLLLKGQPQNKQAFS